MKTKKEYIDILKLHVPELKNQFGIRSFRLFGSVARDEQQDDSDVDVCVEMDPDLYQLVGLKQFLEKLLGCSVDVIRIHRNMNKLLMKQIEKDGFMSSDIQEMVLGIFRQIENSILLLQEWNTEINQVDDYLLSPEGMKNLAASCMLIEAIGEGVKKIDKKTGGVLLPMRQEIPWSRVMGMRDHIAHGYFDIDADVVFQTIKNSKFMCLSRHERNWRKTLPSRMNTAFVCRISDMKLIENQSKCRPIAAPIS